MTLKSPKSLCKSVMKARANLAENINAYLASARVLNYMSRIKQSKSKNISIIKTDNHVHKLAPKFMLICFFSNKLYHRTQTLMALTFRNHALLFDTRYFF